MSIALATISLEARMGRHVNHAVATSNSSASVVQTLPAAELTQEQQDALIFMYQEEKLARDVYTVLGETWSSTVFDRIKYSEQKHMDAVKYLLDKYSLPTPVISDEVGVFDNEELQSLYDQLIEKGNLSLQDAYEAAITVEETDIADLEAKMVDMPADIYQVFSNIDKGSYKHLSIFNTYLNNLQ